MHTEWCGPRPRPSAGKCGTVLVRGRWPCRGGIVAGDDLVVVVGSDGVPVDTFGGDRDLGYEGFHREFEVFVCGALVGEGRTTRFSRAMPSESRKDRSCADRNDATRVPTRVMGREPTHSARVAAPPRPGAGAQRFRRLAGERTGQVALGTGLQGSMSDGTVTLGIGAAAQAAASLVNTQQQIRAG